MKDDLKEYLQRHLPQGAAEHIIKKLEAFETQVSAQSKQLESYEDLAVRQNKKLNHLTNENNTLKIKILNHEKET
jgi:hypothetical protein